MPRVNVSLSEKDYQRLAESARKNGRSDSAQLAIMAGFTPVLPGPPRKIARKDSANG